MRPGSRGLVVLGVLSSAAFLALAAAHLDRGRVAAALAGARLLPFLPLAVLCYLAGHGVRGARLRRLVSREASLTLPTATGVVVIGYAVNNVLPARLGELARAWMLREKSGLSLVQSLTVTFLERLLDGLTLLALFALTLRMLPTQGWMVATFEVAGTILGVATALVLLAVLTPGFLLSLASRAASRLAPAVHDRVVGAVGGMVNGVAYLRRPGDALAVALLGLLVWLLEAGMYLFLLPAFGLGPSPWVALLAMAGTNLGILLPSTPGYIGPFHFFCKQALVSTGVPEGIAFSYAFVAHLAFYLPITAWGVAVLFAHGLSVGRTALLSRQSLRAGSPGTAPPAVGAALVEGRAGAAVHPPSRFMRALVESLGPLEEDDLPAAERAAAVREVAEFVEGQIEALPVRLVLLHRLGMAGFRLATRVVFLRGFTALPLARRRRWVERWAYGNVPPARQLFRAARGTALLAWYECSAVRAAVASRAAVLEGVHGRG